MNYKQYCVSFVPKFIKARNKDDAADIVLQDSGNVEIDEIEEEFLEMDDDS